MISGINSNYSYGYYSSIVNYNNIDSISRSWRTSLNSIYDTQNVSSIQMSGYADDLRTTFSNLEGTSKVLMSSTDDSVFKERTATSTDTDVVTGQAETGATKETYEVDVDQLAKAQKNKSTSFDRDASNTFSTGDQTFEITQDGSSEQLTVNVASGDTNQDILNKMASAVNDSSLDVEAKVVDNDDGTSYLQIKASSTGADNSFTVSDVSGTLAADTGADNISQQVRDAQYSVDGVSYTASSNEVTIDEENVSLTLSGVGTAEVTVASDQDEIVGAAEDFIEDYNETIDTLNASGYSDQARDLSDSMARIAEYDENDLESIGIEVDSEGRLSLDEEELVSSIEEDADEVESVLGSSTSIASEVNSKADIASSSPISKYLDWSGTNSWLNSYADYSFYGPTGQSWSPFNYFQSGLLYDGYW